jgi:hypothetical protein
MRRRLLLLALLAGGLATASGATVADRSTPAPDLAAPGTTLVRTQLADVPAPTTLSRVRDAFGRDHDTRRDVAVALGVALVLTLAGGWWLARERAARMHPARRITILRTRAPPRMPTIVHC